MASRRSRLAAAGLKAGYPMDRKWLAEMRIVPQYIVSLQK